MMHHLRNVISPCLALGNGTHRNPKMPMLEMSNGVQMPALGLGTFQTTDQEEMNTTISGALDSGYRLIDTATMYANEQLIGNALQSYFEQHKNGKKRDIIKREDIFITTKLYFFHMQPKWAEYMIQESLKNLQVDYIDLYLIHAPFAFKCNEFGDPIVVNGKFVNDYVPIIDTWRVLEKYYKLGKLKCIGVSNFNRQQLLALYEQAEIKPQNLQIEANILHQNKDIIDLCHQMNITVTGYCTLGSPRRRDAKLPGNWPEADCLNHPLTIELSRKYGKAPAQILLKREIQRNIAVIPKSSNPTRLRENIDLFDFHISDWDMQRMDKIDEKIRIFLIDFAAQHPEFPWREDLPKGVVY
ncbi:alcohol dehydrogenase [Aphelenchoides bicaudatus]|nr:alcohol dehydrogenase [Aphelenchoides bicaudatus]